MSEIRSRGLGPCVRQDKEVNTVKAGYPGWSRKGPFCPGTSNSFWGSGAGLTRHHLASSGVSGSWTLPPSSSPEDESGVAN